MPLDSSGSMKHLIKISPVANVIKFHEAQMNIVSCILSKKNVARFQTSNKWTYGKLQS